PVGDGAGDDREEEDRRELQRADEAELERRVGQREDEPRLPDRLHPRPDERDELAGPEQAEIAVIQRAQRRRERPPPLSAHAAQCTREPRRPEAALTPPARTMTASVEHGARATA